MSELPNEDWSTGDGHASPLQLTSNRTAMYIREGTAHVTKGTTENISLADKVLWAAVYSLEECCLPIFSCVLHGLTPKTELFSNCRLQPVYPGHTDPWCDSVAIHAAPEFLPGVASYRTQKPPPNVILPPAAPHYWADSSFRANNRWFLA